MKSVLYGIIISIHAPREGGDGNLVCNFGQLGYFNPRPPRGGRHKAKRRSRTPPARFQSTPPARGATTITGYYVWYTYISIHAPREGGDSFLFCFIFLCFDFNPRPPRGGRRSTEQRTQEKLYFNPRPPRGGRLIETIIINTDGDFNPRPPRGGRLLAKWYKKKEQLFQSTPPARGATTVITISILLICHFNPRPPRGGRLSFRVCDYIRGIFQSTPPARGATTVSRTLTTVLVISIHAPREGGDYNAHGCYRPCNISIHAPREGGDKVARTV